MVRVEENSTVQISVKNEKLILSILSEKFTLLNYHKIIGLDSQYWEVDLYRFKYHIIPKRLGYVYPMERREFTSVVIVGDAEVFMETAKKLEANGFYVVIQNSIK